MPMMGKLAHARGDEADPVLMGFDFLDGADLHAALLLNSRAHLGLYARIIRCYRSILRINGSAGLEIRELRCDFFK